MDLPHRHPPPVHKRFRFLGLRWRFLKEKALKDTVEVPLKLPSHCSVPHRCTAIDRVILSDVRLGPETQLQIDNQAEKSVDDRQKIERMLIEVRNAKLFNRQNLQSSNSLVEEKHTTLSPRVEDVVQSVLPKAPVRERGSKQKSSRGHQRHLAQHDYYASSLAASTTTEELRQLEICENFRMFAIEKGLRVPSCVSVPDIDMKSSVTASVTNHFTYVTVSNAMN
jgi:hypothetical protein